MTLILINKICFKFFAVPDKVYTPYETDELHSFKSLWFNRQI